MRLITNGFLTTSLAVFTALAVGPVRAADVAASSAVDAVTVYPDGASVTRVITVDIPAGDKGYTINDSFTLPMDSEVISAGGHAHYLAKTMRMTAILPNGEKKELFDIPDWKFNWQERYYFSSPIRLPKGTRMDVQISYDNSSANPSNPSLPPKRVTFGEQSTDEMGSVTIEVVPVNETDLPTYAAEVQSHLQSAVINLIRRRVQ